LFILRNLLYLSDSGSHFTHTPRFTLLITDPSGVVDPGTAKHRRPSDMRWAPVPLKELNCRKLERVQGHPKDDDGNGKPRAAGKVDLLDAGGNHFPFGSMAGSASRDERVGADNDNGSGNDRYKLEVTTKARKAA